jgi:phosphopantothenoylcysteine decarboxylase / phosphopantothenate---cysteine ligase
LRGHVVLGVSGGIAAFRSLELLRLLVKASCKVTPILTRNATRFVSPRSFAVLAGTRAQVSLWAGAAVPSIDHVDLSRHADLLVVAPATANVIAKMAGGIADDALTTYALAHRRGLVVAPAMNTVMWEKPAVQAALAVLGARGAVVVPPATGLLADGEIGPGRLAPLDRIVAEVFAALPARGPMAGLRVLITAGPTREAIDSVRVITNRSSGRMGVALAATAARLGGAVTLLAGAGVMPPPEVSALRFESAADLEALLARHAPVADVVLHAAAVADFKPRQTATGKLDRRAGGIALELEPVPDLAKGMPRADGRPYLVIFAAEMATRLEARAAQKLAEKLADAVVANPIDEPGLGMEAARNRAVVLTNDGARLEFAVQDKERLALELLLALTPGVVARARP